MSRRYRCGNCGEEISKKGKTCIKCDIPIEEYKKPHHELTRRLKIWYYLSIMIIVVFIASMVLEIILIWVYDVVVTQGVVFIFLGVFGAVTFSQIRKLKKEGLVRCNKCNRRQALHAKYCIQCGNKIKLVMGF